MFYLDKCENCDRYGSVALEPDDTLCNLCKVAKKDKKTENKDGEEKE